MWRFLLVLPFLTGCITGKAPSPRPPLDPTVVASNTLEAVLRIDVASESGARAHGTAWVVEPGIAVTAKHVTFGRQHYQLKDRHGHGCLVERVEEHPEEDVSLVWFSGCDDTNILATRYEKVAVGERAHAAGHPFWSDWTFTTGTVANADVGGRIQLDAVAEPGMSGGPAVDAYGRVIGVVVSVLADPLGRTWGGETFAVPISVVVEFLDEQTKPR